MTETTTILPIAELPGETQERLLALNTRHQQETSFLSPEAWQTLVAEAFLAIATPDGHAFMIAFAPGADYQSPNYRWFGERYDRFAYVDRVVVGEAARGRGLARALYAELGDAARAAGLERIVCEVNRVPPNPGSDAFHARLGFEEVGRGALEGGAKTVRYLALAL
ncbi:MAG: GNAT family N-acetyltransferase [Pseudomonadota bacterium]